MDNHSWNNLVVDAGASPLPLGPERFRQWMERARIFISSVMDAEMNPYRELVRSYLCKEGATPVMWEEISPEDKGPTRAFLDAVEQSNLFVLVLGNRYGVSDGTGYSPTHKEANRAKELQRPRLLFTLPDIKRDGRLNDWLRSLYSGLSGTTVDSPEAFVVQLESRLREFAARSERNWLKLGPFVFPGKVRTEASREGQRFTVTGRPSRDAVRNGLVELGHGRGGSSPMRLTWPNRSAIVQIDSITTESEFVGDESVQIACKTPQSWTGNTGAPLSGISIGGVEPMTPGDIASLWARRAILGEKYKSKNNWDMLDSMTATDAPTLPHVLQETRATGWLAEGLARIYAVEEVARRQGGQFSRLDVGPATAQGVRLDGEFEIAAQLSATRYAVAIQGVIPLT